MNKTTFRSPLTLTKKAKGKWRELGLEERSFFSLETSYSVWMEKYPGLPPSVALFFENQLPDGRTLVLHCAVERTQLIVVNVTARAAHAAVGTNWRRPLDLTIDQKLYQVPAGLLQFIQDMPVAQESSDYVKKRIASWEGYLKIQERHADIPDMTARFGGITFNSSFSRATLTGCQLKEQEWKSLKDLSVKLKGIDKEIGKVLKANWVAGTVEVELSVQMADRARKQGFDTAQKEVTFSNFAALSQVKRLRQGFKQLEDGLAANPALEKLLFEHKPPVQEPKKNVQLPFHNRLNEFQQKAVTGAMAAEDLYVIQGPPGTGKTTVISEICLQNARAGLRTLVASQSNLAVDNALSRLLAHKDIRILRVGRTESIEEEGKKFIEENVGQYWKDHTLEEVSEQFDARAKRKEAMDAEWTANEAAYEETEPLLKQSEEAVEAKKQAEREQQEMEPMLQELNKQKQAAEQARALLHQQITEMEQSYESLTAQIKKDEAFLREQPDDEATGEQLQETINRLNQSLKLDEIKEHMNKKKDAIARETEAYEQKSEALQQTGLIAEKAAGVKRIDGLKWLMLEQNIERTSRIVYFMNELDDLRTELDQSARLRTYNDQLSKAIDYVEKLLVPHRVPLVQLKQRAVSTPASYTSEEIDHFLNDLRENIRHIDPRTLTSYLSGLYSRKYFVWQRAKRVKASDAVKERARDTFQSLKQEVTEQLWQKQYAHETSCQKAKQSIQQAQTELQALQAQHNELAAAVSYVPDAAEQLKKAEASLAEWKRNAEHVKKLKQQLDTNREEKAKQHAQIGTAEQKRTQLDIELETVQKNIREQEEALAVLQEILSGSPEQEHEALLKKMARLSFQRETLKQEKKRWPLLQSVQEKWLSMLKDASDHDLDEIRKLYVKHANVIGTTCVASARKDFIEQYPVFDVVIIDEVSKATPPELLLPMLKGKKVILVGDHHQLPPLFGNDTLEETLQEVVKESDDFDGKAELKNLLKESLFERLFHTLPDTHKQMLAIQYRMHEDIMETISPFYEGEKDRLQCGLTDSDADRDHKLESPTIKRGDHLVWVDMPNEPAFFEEKMKGGKSLFNPAELREVSGMLTELNAAAEKAGIVKSVGVISFYGEQVKRIDRLLSQELRLPHLTVRTGTVDRFQGMEMDVILLSMVRNHANRNEDIGFAKDYRRLNVALSRAKELLVLIGSTTMFTERTKQADMYKHVLRTVKTHNGLREVSLHG
ncbi:DEAD/DEAH box helicase [Domibacillus enclensis]|uniref:AAA domain-containing protein n=1 Tax=Domibacillus enclensis TaxID=1017273 RepID=A0A1N6RLE1_9BACI|nr:AAA domain-containing protein [Domibacillus enclensis]OXS79088.1 ATP-dependent helicase [Domibacillus enclensis]SIQ29522.1 AAA domain-containing protein [Domibacillus enclensis]